MMRNIFLFVVAISLIGFVGCDTSPDSIVIDTRDGDDGGNNNGGNTNGTGVDPGKSAVACYPAFEDDELNVATWNIEWFPNSGNTTVAKVKEIVENLDADIIAVQEINSPSQFFALASGLDGWEAALADVNYDQDIGYLYKKNAFTSFGTLTQLFGGDSYNFPRQVVRVDVTHASGLEVTFLNLHLKCCGEDGSSEYNRRKQASLSLKSYIDANLANKAVIVLGDYNDDINSSTSAFQNFKDDPNYTFADQAVADGSSSNWSYPSWPSHIDHILITDELFNKVRNVQTLKPENCVSSYSSTVSDHRPVLASFK